MGDKVNGMNSLSPTASYSGTRPQLGMAAPNPIGLEAPAVAPQCVLVIDDTASVRELLGDILQAEGYRLEFAASGAAGLGLAAAVEPDVILLDVMMPGMDGFEVCHRLRADPELAGVPVIMITALDDRESRRRAITEMVDEFITKPFDATELRMRIRSLMRLNRYRQIVEQRRQLEETLNGVVHLLAEVLAIADPQAGRFAEQLQQVAGALADTLGPDNASEIKLAALLSNIGEMTLPSRVIAAKRSPSGLSDTERELWSRIPAAGHALLRHIPNFSAVARAVLYQQKRFDGSGFPADAVRGAALPLGACVLKFASDLLELELKGTPRAAALDALRLRLGWYDPRVVGAAELLWAVAPEVARVKQPQRYRFAAVVQDLRQGQILMGDVVTAEGTLLVSAGKALTEAVVERIRNFAHLVGVREPIEIESHLPKAA